MLRNGTEQLGELSGFFRGGFFGGGTPPKKGCPPVPQNKVPLVVCIFFFGGGAFLGGTQPQNRVPPPQKKGAAKKKEEVPLVVCILVFLFFLGGTEGGGAQKKWVWVKLDQVTAGICFMYRATILGTFDRSLGDPKKWRWLSFWRPFKAAKKHGRLFLTSHPLGPLGSHSVPFPALWRQNIRRDRRAPCFRPDQMNVDPGLVSPCLLIWVKWSESPLKPRTAPYLYHGGLLIRGQH